MEPERTFHKWGVLAGGHTSGLPWREAIYDLMVLSEDTTFSDGPAISGGSGPIPRARFLVHELVWERDPESLIYQEVPIGPQASIESASRGSVGREPIVTAHHVEAGVFEARWANRGLFVLGDISQEIYYVLRDGFLRSTTSRYRFTRLVPYGGHVPSGGSAFYRGGASYGGDAHYGADTPCGIDAGCDDISCGGAAPYRDNAPRGNGGSCGDSGPRGNGASRGNAPPFTGAMPVHSPHHIWVYAQPILVDREFDPGIPGFRTVILVRLNLGITRLREVTLALGATPAAPRGSMAPGEWTAPREKVAPREGTTPREGMAPRERLAPPNPNLSSTLSAMLRAILNLVRRALSRFSLARAQSPTVPASNRIDHDVEVPGSSCVDGESDDLR